MQPPEVITKWKRCNQCGWDNPTPSICLKTDGMEQRYCMFCGAVFVGDFHARG